jgi:hypothetical protein
MSEISQKQAQINKEINDLKVSLSEINTFLKRDEDLLIEVKKSDDYQFIKKTGVIFNLKFRESDFYSPLCKEILIGRINAEIKKQKSKAKETEYDIISHKNDLESLTVCPQCSGKGVITETKYIREDGQINHTVHINKCPNCLGTGKLSK